MSQLLDFGKGYRTYGLAAILAISWWAQLIGLIDESIFRQVSFYVTPLLTATVGLKVGRG